MKKSLHRKMIRRQRNKLRDYKTTIDQMSSLITELTHERDMSVRLAQGTAADRDTYKKRVAELENPAHQIEINPDGTTKTVKQVHNGQSGLWGSAVYSAINNIGKELAKEPVKAKFAYDNMFDQIIASCMAVEINGAKFTKVSNEPTKEPQGFNGSVFVDEVNVQGTGEVQLAKLREEIEELKKDLQAALDRNKEHKQFATRIIDGDLTPGHVAYDAWVINNTKGITVLSWKDLWDEAKEGWESIGRAVCEAQLIDRDFAEHIDNAAPETAFVSMPASALSKLNQLLSGLILRTHAYHQYAMTPLSFKEMCVLYGDPRADTPAAFMIGKTYTNPDKQLDDAMYGAVTTALEKKSPGFMKGVEIAETGEAVSESRFGFEEYVTTRLPGFGDAQGMKCVVTARSWDAIRWVYDLTTVQTEYQPAGIVAKNVPEDMVQLWQDDPTEDPELQAMMEEAGCTLQPTTTSDSSPSQTDLATTSDTTDQNAL